MNSSFHLEIFLLQLEEANTRLQVLQLLKEFEQHCAIMTLEECQQVSGQVAERMSDRLNLLSN